MISKLRQLARLVTDRRLRTPRIASVMSDDGAILRLVFDMPMDTTHLDSTLSVRYFSTDGKGTIWDFTGESAGWDGPRTLLLEDGVDTGLVHTGTPHALYRQGNLRARARFEVPVGERCDKIVPLP